MRQARERLGKPMPPVLSLILLLMCGAKTAVAALPIAFEENRGQVAPEVAFLARTSAYRVFLTHHGAVITSQGGRAVRISLADSRATAPNGAHLLLAKTNYLLGSDSARWKRGIANYEAVTYSQPYPGIDVTWHSRGNEVEHDFLLDSGADPRLIRLVFSGAALRLTPEGDLMAGALRFHKPRAYQDGREVECRYELRGRSVGFAIGAYDRARPLKIDPVLSFSTYLGGSADTQTSLPPSTTAAATALDDAGNVYVGGTTSSLDFPTTAGAFQPSASGGVCGVELLGTLGPPPTYPCSDIFIAKFSRDGSTLLSSTYLGGSGNDTITAITVGPTGNLYLIGNSEPADNAPGSASNAGFPRLKPLPGQTLTASTSLVAGLNADVSSLLFATAVPGNAVALAVDSAGAVYITGTTFGGFPTVNAFQQTLADGDVFKTTDSGNHWQAVRSNLQPDYIYSGAADPIQPQVLYVATTGGLYKTTDGGANWSFIGNGLPIGNAFAPAQWNSVAIDSQSPQTLYVGGDYGVYKSTNGGVSWVASSSGPGVVASLAVTQPSTLYAGTQGGVYKSTDGAATWRPTGLADPLNGFTPLVVADPTNAATVYAIVSVQAAGFALMKTTDGGVTWKSLGSFIDVAIDPASPQTLYALGNSGPSKTTDGGATWTQLSFPSQGGAAKSIRVDPQLHTRIWVEVDGGLFVSLDAGATWTRMQVPHMPALFLTDAGGAAYLIRGTEYQGGPTLGDAFVTKLDPTGSSIVYSTYLGGMGRDLPGGIAVDAAGRAYVAGETDSTDFPLASPLQPQFGGNSDVFVSVLDPGGSHLVWSTFLGGSLAEGASAIALDAAGNVHLAGTVSVNEAFPTALQLSTFTTAYSQYSYNMRSTADAYAAKIKGDGSAVVYSARLGGSAFDSARSVSTDVAGNTYIAGATYSKDFPTLNAVEPALAGNLDAFVAELDGATGAARYATYLGGSRDDFAGGVAADAAGDVYVAGATASSDFPLKSAWRSSFTTSSGFLAKISALNSTMALTGLANAASYTAMVAPGELVSLFGTSLAASSASAPQLPLPKQLSDAQVTFNGVAAPLVYASAQQVNAQIPFETQTGSAQVQATSGAGAATTTVQVVAVAPAIFALNQQGTGPGAILHGATYQVVTDANPAAGEEIISIYCTGLGAVNPPAQTGAAPPDPPPHTVIPVQVSIGGTTEQATYAGVAPGFPGLYQVNAQIPAGTPSGAQPLQIIQNGVASNTVTVAVR